MISPVLPAYTFPYEWDALTAETTVETTFRVLIDGHPVFDATLIPWNGHIRLNDLSSILQDYSMGAIQRVELQYHTPAGWQQGARSTVFPLYGRRSVRAVEWLARRFLTLSPPDFPVFTYSEGTDTIAWVGTERAATLTAEWISSSGAKTTQHTLPASVGADHGVCECDVSPAKIPRPSDSAARLASYTVEVGARRQRYVVLPDGFSTVPATDFSFLSPFGVSATARAFAPAESADHPTITTGRYAGRRIVTQIEPQPSVQVSFGPLPPGDTESLLQIVRAPRIVRRSDGVPLIVTQADLKVSHSLTAPAFAALTLSPTDGDPVDTSGWGGGIFDSTFDSTYE